MTPNEMLQRWCELSNRREKLISNGIGWLFHRDELSEMQYYEEELGL